MKKFQKIKFTIVGVVALITTVALNVRHALNDYGLRDNTLHLEVLAQAISTDGMNQNKSGGPRAETTVHCKINTTTTVTSGGTTGGTINWGAILYGNANWGVYSGGVSGGYGAGGSSNSGSSTTVTTTIYMEFDALMYYCTGQDNSSCSPNNPCQVKLDN
jgi:hypothetical protein